MTFNHFLAVSVELELPAWPHSAQRIEAQVVDRWGRIQDVFRTSFSGFNRYEKVVWSVEGEDAKPCRPAVAWNAFRDWFNRRKRSCALVGRVLQPMLDAKRAVSVVSIDDLVQRSAAYTCFVMDRILGHHEPFLELSQLVFEAGLKDRAKSLLTREVSIEGLCIAVRPILRSLRLLA